MVLNEIFWTFFLQKHKVLIVIDIWVNLEQFLICVRGSKTVFKSPKLKKWPKNKEIQKNDVLERFLRARYAVIMNFNNVL